MTDDRAPGLPARVGEAVLIAILGALGAKAAEMLVDRIEKRAKKRKAKK